MTEKLLVSDNTRQQLRNDLKLANDKTINIEEELFESKH